MASLVFTSLDLIHIHVHVSIWTVITQRIYSDSATPHPAFHGPLWFICQIPVTWEDTDCEISWPIHVIMTGCVVVSNFGFSSVVRDGKLGG